MTTVVPNTTSCHNACPCRRWSTPSSAGPSSTRVTAGEIARVGLDGVTLREIARAGGWTTGIVSHYFVDKRDLLLATFRSRADAAHDRIDVSLAAGASMLDAIVDSALPLDEEGALNWKVWLAFWGAAVGDPELSAAQQDRHRSFHRALAQALAAEQAAGRLRQELDIDYEARRLVAVLDGIAVQSGVRAAVLAGGRPTPDRRRARGDTC